MENKFRQLFKVLANEDRILMMRHLGRYRGLTPTQVRDKFYMEQPTVSYHLRSLQKADAIVNHGRSGRYIFYSLNRPFLEKVFKEFIDFVTNTEEDRTND